MPNIYSFVVMPNISIGDEGAAEIAAMLAAELEEKLNVSEEVITALREECAEASRRHQQMELEQQQVHTRSSSTSGTA